MSHQDNMTFICSEYNINPDWRVDNSCFSLPLSEDGEKQLPLSVPQLIVSLNESPVRRVKKEFEWNHFLTILKEYLCFSLTGAKSKLRASVARKLEPELGPDIDGDGEWWMVALMRLIKDEDWWIRWDRTSDRSREEVTDLKRQKLNVFLSPSVHWCC